MPQLDFTTSDALSIGVELELMLVNTRDFNLAPDADDLLRRDPGKTTFDLRVEGSIYARPTLTAEGVRRSD